MFWNKIWFLEKICVEQNRKKCIKQKNIYFALGSIKIAVLAATKLHESIGYAGGMAKYHSL